MQSASQTGRDMIRVLVADHTLIYTQLLAGALQRDSGLEVTSSLWDSRGLAEAIHAQNFDVIIISSNLGEEPLRGFEALRELRAMQPGIRVVMLLDSSKRETILEAFRAGARGIFTRNQSVDVLVKCVRRVHEGQIWADSEQMSYAVEALAAAPAVRAVDANGFDLLSKRELEVVQSLAEGLTNREIAEKLGLSQHTVKNYLFRVFDKLGVSSRVELLFMTLSQAGTPQSATSVFVPDGESPELSGREPSLGQQTPHQGPLQMARMYADGTQVARDPVAAYMWYVVCEKTNFEMRDQIVAAKRKLANLLTTDEILDAQKQAQERMLHIANNGNGSAKPKAMGTAPGDGPTLLARG
jgi:two-component system, NarL family, nitrate/nitrite response regulator NarL